MKKLVLLLLLVFTFSAQAATHDFSGVYDCIGDDAHEGKYTGTVTMKLKPEHSKGEYASYDFKLEVADYGTYSGHAAANGKHVAMHFGLPNHKNNDYGTGIAVMKKVKTGKWSFHKFYFEPEFKGGNTGIEDCTQK